MRRALIVFIAVLALVLVYPATMPSAKSPSNIDLPHVITGQDAKYLPDNPAGSGDGDGDSGDADDIGGWKDGGKTYWQRSGFGPRSAAKVWWMYFLFVYRVY